MEGLGGCSAGRRQRHVGTARGPQFKLKRAIRFWCGRYLADADWGGGLTLVLDGHSAGGLQGRAQLAPAATGLSARAGQVTHQAAGRLSGRGAQQHEGCEREDPHGCGTSAKGSRGCCNRDGAVGDRRVIIKPSNERKNNSSPQLNAQKGGKPCGLHTDRSLLLQPDLPGAPRAPITLIDNFMSFNVVSHGGVQAQACGGLSLPACTVRALLQQPAGS
jgi:hypothetical protein